MQCILLALVYAGYFSNATLLFKCILTQYAPCDLSVLRTKYPNSELYVTPVFEDFTKVGIPVKLGEDGLYSGNKENAMATVCEKDEKGVLTKIATIEFTGILDFPHKMVVSYGHSFEFRAMVILPKTQKPSLDKFYSRIAVKDNCLATLSSSTLLAKLDVKRSVAIFQSEWEVVYKSERPYELFTDAPKICICLKETCGPLDYNHFVKTLTIEGPILTSLLKAACTVGSRCIVTIDGNFSDSRNHFVVAENEELKYTSPNLYEYSIDYDRFSAFTKKTLLINWVSGLNASIKPMVGELEVQSAYIGKLPVAPFGVQTILLNWSKVFACKLSRFYIFKRPRDTSLAPELDPKLWTLVEELTVVLDGLRISKGFDMESDHVLKYADGCNGHAPSMGGLDGPLMGGDVTSVGSNGRPSIDTMGSNGTPAVATTPINGQSVPSRPSPQPSIPSSRLILPQPSIPSFGDLPLVSILVPTGVTAYGNYLCELGVVCNIEFPTIGLKDEAQGALFKKRKGHGRYQILLAKECGRSDAHPFLSQNGLSTGGKFAQESSEFSWVGKTSLDASLIGTKLKACWCGKVSTEGFKCRVDDFTIEVGSLLVTAPAKNRYECWLGAMCSITLDERFEKEVDKIILSPSCNVASESPSNGIAYNSTLNGMAYESTFNGDSDSTLHSTATGITIISDQEEMFAFENLKSGTTDKTILTTEMGVTEGLVGKLRICQKKRGRDDGEFRDLEVEINVKRMQLEKDVYYVGMEESLVLKAKEPIKGEQYLLIKQFRRDVGDATLHRSKLTDIGVKVETKVRAGSSQIGWCMVSRHMACERIEDFRYNIAKLVTEGIVNLKEPLRCNSGTNCRLGFVFQSIFDGRWAPNLVDPGANLVIRNSACTSAALPTDVNVWGGYFDKVKVYKQTNDGLILRYFQEFAQRLDGVFPGPYLLCLESKRQMKMVPLANIDISGLYEQFDPVRLVVLGSPFKITVRGYGLDETISAFLSLESTCMYANPTAKILDIEMNGHPDFIYTENKTSVATWTGVRVLRRPYLGPLNEYEESLKNGFELERTLYLCIGYYNDPTEGRMNDAMDTMDQNVKNGMNGRVNAHYDDHYGHRDHSGMGNGRNNSSGSDTGQPNSSASGTANGHSGMVHTPIQSIMDNETRYSGVEYKISGPGLVTEDLMAQGPKRFEMVVDAKRPVFRNGLMIVSFIGVIPPLVTCEEGGFTRDGNVMYTVRFFEGNAVSWYVSDSVEKSLICWCGGSQCSSIDDFRTTLRLPRMGVNSLGTFAGSSPITARSFPITANSSIVFHSSPFMALPMADRFSVSLVGAHVTPLDEIRLVDKGVKCGLDHSFKMTNDLDVDDELEALFGQEVKNGSLERNGHELSQRNEGGSLPKNWRKSLRKSKRKKLRNPMNGSMSGTSQNGSAPETLQNGSAPGTLHLPIPGSTNHSLDPVESSRMPIRTLLRLRNLLGSSIPSESQWRSFEMSLRKRPGENVLYKICHCHFLASESCQRDEDFGSLAGIVSSGMNEPQDSLDNLYLCISDEYSDAHDGSHYGTSRPSITCRAYNIFGGEPLAFLVGQIAKYPSPKGLVLEAFYGDVCVGPANFRTHSRFATYKRVGIFSMQSVSVKKDVEEEVMIRGNGPLNVKELILVPFWISCTEGKDLGMSFRPSRSRRDDVVLFKGIKLGDGPFRLCIRTTRTSSGDMGLDKMGAALAKMVPIMTSMEPELFDAGFLIVKDYFIRPAFDFAILPSDHGMNDSTEGRTMDGRDGELSRVSKNHHNGDHSAHSIENIIETHSRDSSGVVTDAGGHHDGQNGHPMEHSFSLRSAHSLHTAHSGLPLVAIHSTKILGILAQEGFVMVSDGDGLWLAPVKAAEGVVDVGREQRHVNLSINGEITRDKWLFCKEFYLDKRLVLVGERYIGVFKLPLRDVVSMHILFSHELSNPLDVALFGDTIFASDGYLRRVVAYYLENGTRNYRYVTIFPNVHWAAICVLPRMVPHGSSMAVEHVAGQESGSGTILDRTPELIAIDAETGEIYRYRFSQDGSNFAFEFVTRMGHNGMVTSGARMNGHNDEQDGHNDDSSTKTTHSGHYTHSGEASTRDHSGHHPDHSPIHYTPCSLKTSGRNSTHSFERLREPSSMDIYSGSFGGQDVQLMFVAEKKTGRIVVFKLNEREIVDYMVFYTRGIVSRIAVDSSRTLFILSWRKYLGRMEQFLLYKPAHHYVKTNFYYNVFEKYQGGDEVYLEPVLGGGTEFLFSDAQDGLAGRLNAEMNGNYGGTINGSPGAQNGDVSTINGSLEATNGSPQTTNGSSQTINGSLETIHSSIQSVGLRLDPKTGIISGRLSVTGRRTFTIFASTILKETSTRVTIHASCPQATRFNAKLKVCESCPIGTFRNDEPDDECIKCSTVRLNSTTRDVGSRFASDCLCEPGFYLDNEECVPCKAGTFKSDVSNSECSGTCQDNLTSRIVGAKSEDDLLCECMPKFYDSRMGGSAWNGHNDDQNNEHHSGHSTIHTCVPCSVGYYCPGGSAGEQPCGYGKSTLDRYSFVEEDCACDAGFGLGSDGKCGPCSQFGYKDKVGNVSCIECHAHNSKRGIRPLLSGSILLFDELADGMVTSGARMNGHNGEQNGHNDDSSTKTTHSGYNSPLLQTSMDTLPTIGTLHEMGRAYGMYKDYLKRLNRGILVTRSAAATSVKECRYCISGYYFEGNAKDCLPCPIGSFCPGFDNQPIRCGTNATTREDRSISGIDCLCSSGYGNILQYRNPINLSVVCHQCPIGYFQHLNNTDVSCLPCPAGSSTTLTGSQGLESCIPEAGFFIKVTRMVPTGMGNDSTKGRMMGSMDHHNGQNDHSGMRSMNGDPQDAHNVHSGHSIETHSGHHSSIMATRASMETFEEWYERSHFVRDGRYPDVECISAKGLTIDATFSTFIMRESIQSCQSECRRNIYCTGFLFYLTEHFSHRDTTPYTTSEILIFSGTRYTRVEFFICKLFFFTLDVYDDSGMRTNGPLDSHHNEHNGEYNDHNGEYNAHSFSIPAHSGESRGDTGRIFAKRAKNVGNQKQVLCRLVAKFPYIAQPCPMDHYCPGQNKPVACPQYSKTLGVGAKTLESCLCLAGYEPSLKGGRCDACKMGWYKEEVGNFACKRCPDHFRTFSLGARSITECACIPGHFATLFGQHIEAQHVFKVDGDGNVTIRRNYGSGVRMNGGRMTTMKDGMNGHNDDSGVSHNDHSGHSIETHSGHSAEGVDSLIFLTGALLMLPRGSENLARAKELGYSLGELVCERCKANHYCPGGWIGGLTSKRIHNIPYRCPAGSSVPSRSTHATTLSQCLCLPGYRLDGMDGMRSMNGSDQRENEWWQDGMRRSSRESPLPSQGKPTFIQSHKSTRHWTERMDGSSSDRVNPGASRDHSVIPESTASFFQQTLHSVNQAAHIAKCVRCEGGMYKESHENSPCSGRCMQYATTYGGSVSKNQCFCQYGRFMVMDGSDQRENEWWQDGPMNGHHYGMARMTLQDASMNGQNDDHHNDHNGVPLDTHHSGHSLKHHYDQAEKREFYEGKMVCAKCVKGAVCPGGLVANALQKLQRDANFGNFTLQDHVQPIPKFGYFAISPYFARGSLNAPTNGRMNEWPTKGRINGRQYGHPFHNAHPAHSGHPGHYGEVDFHPCPLEFRCDGRFASRCSEGSGGYLCGQCMPGYDNAHYRSHCTKCGSWFYELFSFVTSKALVLAFGMMLLLASMNGGQNGSNGMGHYDDQNGSVWKEPSTHYGQDEHYGMGDNDHNDHHSEDERAHNGLPLVIHSLEFRGSFNASHHCSLHSSLRIQPLLAHLCTLLKIAFEFYLSMAPYGMVHLRSTGSLKKFASEYNGVFGHSLRVFGYFRTSCFFLGKNGSTQGRMMVSMDDHNGPYGGMNGDYGDHRDHSGHLAHYGRDATRSIIRMWYLQKFSSLLYPLVDAMLLFLAFHSGRLIARIPQMLSMARQAKWSKCENMNGGRETRMVSMDEASLCASDNGPLGQGELQPSCLYRMDLWQNDVMATMDHNGQNGMDGPLNAHYGHSIENILETHSGMSRKESEMNMFVRCLLVMGYIYFSFICQELLQMVWCIHVQYKQEEPLSVLLHMPLQVCEGTDSLFYYGTMAAIMCLVAVMLVYVPGLAIWMMNEHPTKGRMNGSKNGDYMDTHNDDHSGHYALNIMDHYGKSRLHRLPLVAIMAIHPTNFASFSSPFICGHKKNFGAWDSLYFLRRFVTATIVTFQASAMSFGPAEKFRVIATILSSIVMLVLHTKYSPFELRNDDVFNKVELLALGTNIATGFIMHGSFSFDFDYVGLVPIYLFFLIFVLIMWYAFAEFCHSMAIVHGWRVLCQENGMSSMNAHNGSLWNAHYNDHDEHYGHPVDHHSGHTVDLHKREWFHKFTVWYNRAQVAFDYKNKRYVLEDPLARGMRISSAGRGALQMCVHQSIYKLVLEKGCLAIPRLWMEFLVRQGFLYRMNGSTEMRSMMAIMDSMDAQMNGHQNGQDEHSMDVHRDHSGRPIHSLEIYDEDPITPWMISRATMETPTAQLLDNYEGLIEEHGLKACKEDIEREFRRVNVREALARLEEMQELEEELEKVNRELEERMEAARRGKIATMQIMELVNGWRPECEAWNGDQREPVSSLTY